MENGRSQDGLTLTLPPELLEQLVAAVAQRVLLAVPAASPYLSVTEAADYLRCGRQRIYDLTSSGRLPFVKDGSRVLLRRADLDAYLEASP